MGSTTAPTRPAPRRRIVLQPGWRPGQPVDRTGCPGRGKHGTASAASRRGCICADAREALRIYKKRQRERRLQPAYWPAIGTQRRIRALQAAGWPIQMLADRLGCTKQHVSHLARAHDLGEHVHRRSAKAVNLLYLALRDQPGPSTSAAKRAAAKGWATPDQWLPDEIDDPDALSDLDHQRAGSSPRLGAEYLEKLEVLGFTVEDIAADRGIAVDSVERAIARERDRRAREERRKVSDGQLEHAIEQVLAGALTQKDAAAALGISRSHLCNVMKGRGRPEVRSVPAPRRTTSRPPTTAPHQEGRVA